MSRDMKPRKSRSSGNRKKSGGGTLIGLFLGLVIGVVAAAGVVWYINKSPRPFAEKFAEPISAADSPNMTLACRSLACRTSTPGNTMSCRTV